LDPRELVAWQLTRHAGIIPKNRVRKREGIMIIGNDYKNASKAVRRYEGVRILTGTRSQDGRSER
jgi:hypothetical protein